MRTWSSPSRTLMAIAATPTALATTSLSSSNTARWRRFGERAAIRKSAF
ncbi:MAG: hypothetical protein R3F14_07815 [Polyangiaceae bacterium]